MHAEDSRRFKVNYLCELFGVSKQAYYSRSQNVVYNRLATQDVVLQYSKAQRELDPGIGAVKLWHMYKSSLSTEARATQYIGRDRFVGILSSYGLVLKKKKQRIRTTNSQHDLPLYPNIAKDLLPTRPNQLWVSDITYIPIYTKNGKAIFCYLSLVLDAYTQEIIGWSIGSTLETTYPLEALKMALERLDNKQGHELIHHSDRGCQYASKAYVSLLRKHGIQISMTESGNPKDNAKAERVNSTMKNELLMGKIFFTLRQVKVAVTKAVDFYNNKRPHMSLGMLTPAQAANHKGAFKKLWTSYREIAIKKSRAWHYIPEESLPLYHCFARKAIPSFYGK